MGQAVDRGLIAPTTWGCVADETVQMQRRKRGRGTRARPRRAREAPSPPRERSVLVVLIVAGKRNSCASRDRAVPAREGFHLAMLAPGLLLMRYPLRLAGKSPFRR